MQIIIELFCKSYLDFPAKHFILNVAVPEFPGIRTTRGGIL